MIQKTAQIRIVPKATGSGRLAIPDTMQQVKDFFELLSGENNREIYWALNKVQLNSPFVVTGEPINRTTNELADDSIDQLVRDVATAFESFSSGNLPHASLSPKERNIYTRLFERNRNGIEETEYDFGRGINRIVIDYDLAGQALKSLNKPSELDRLLMTFEVEGHGSITGSLIQVGTYYNKPAFSIEESNTNNSVWCQVDELTIAELEQKMKAKDVWGRQDILVRGILCYNKEGKLAHIRDSKVYYFTREQVSLDELHDPDFSEGLPSEEYLEQLRGE